ncbi:hypothetical protein HMN09_00734000 [Mycena chlorophos]|uniref:Uncharacterized protein n=1 Tax=Mycena chlorophos TaxID=658473 RepID=A0A8H6SWU9_MYCCL|nr:hypothetical protein HMN09_00734000 [Mycena chlorophos]
MLTTTNPYRPTARRARSSSLTIVTAKAQAVVQTMKTVTRPRAASDPGPRPSPRFQRSLCPPRKSCLKSTPTTFEPNLPAGFGDDLVDEEPELDSSLPSSEESSILSADSETDNEKKLSRVSTFFVRVKLALRRRSRARLTHDHAHPNSSRLSVLPLTMPQFSQPGYCTEPVVAFVDGEYEDDDVCTGGVRFVVPDDSHLKQGMDESVLPLEVDDEQDDEELSWAAMQ